MYTKFEMLYTPEGNIMKTEQFKIRATKKELAFISNAAKIAGTNKSQFILDSAKNAAKKLGKSCKTSPDVW